ncbi:DDB1- and CUL4-associated factor 17 [Pantherophis guttatus]|uniref:DDB1- and CUL4-associated factor 17 n=1 Tax=Pantherophis guttatus TaxID=94885 RepID=A0A6P9CUL9_PANGU|nr:DDB1- and CUL4-associated factor 17 [Pantherophis guttatus]XP_034283159.1 DDB1- and CUL4-associated factor 17 [Pantherophis guttatus]XP_060544001.1 DDB1- and CUL4-associated factor 17 [Pantherophis guttatus]
MSSDSSSSAPAKNTSSVAFDIYNICRLLTRRSQGFYTKDAGTVYRKNMSLLRKLICQETTTFKNVCTIQSSSPISYHSGKIYLNNYRRCVSCITPEPRTIYQMPGWPTSEKIEDALLLECPVGEVLPMPSDYKPSWAAVTAHNWLFRLSANSGEILEKVYLASHCKFRYLNWDMPQEVMAIKSTQLKLPAAARRTGIQQSVLYFLAIFRVWPLSFVGMLELDKKIFGNSMADVSVSHEMLIVTHSTGHVRLYSFQAISERFMEHPVDLGQEYSWNGKVGIVGKYPFGIPCNIKITDTPDLLFEVSSLESAFQIGGYPWHYIITPNKKSQEGMFHVCSLKDHTLAKNGIQDMKCCSLEPDRISFHPDSSGRMLHVGPNLIKVLKLKETESAKQQEVTEDFIIEANRENNVNNSVTITASGRIVKKRFKLLDDDPEQETFKIVDYEDELNLLSVVAVTQIGVDGAAHLDFHCNEQGIRLKSFPFVESWDVTYNHEVHFDRDIVLHIQQTPRRMFSCHVYQMTCNSGKDDNIQKGKRRGSVWSKTGGRC